MRYILLFILLLFGIIVADFSSAIIMLFLFVLGTIIVQISFRSNRSYQIKLFQLSFLSTLLFVLLCYEYMQYHNYEYLLGIDSINAFIPKTMSYIESSDGFFSSIKALFEDYNLFDRSYVGYSFGAIIFGYISVIYDIDIYLSLQLYSVFVGAFIPNILFILFKKNGFDNLKSFKYSLLVFILSPLLLFSSMIARDAHVALLYLIAINFIFTEEFKFKNILYLVLIIFICTLFRPESGLFLLVLIPAYLLLTLHNKRQRVVVILSSLVIIIGLASLAATNHNTISFLFEANQENYVEGVAEGSGMIATFQRVPVIGDFVSIIYNAVQPLPFWAHFTVPKGSDRIEMYNIMTFPKSISSFFNWFVIVYILFWIFSKRLRRNTKGYISKPLKFQLWIGLVFLYMQSAVISQRRLMAYYCMFYILFFIIYNHIGAKNKKQITITAIFSFIALQIIGIIYLA